MARRKRHGGRRGMLSKLGRKGGSLAGTAIQLLGAFHGVLAAVLGGGVSPQDMPARIVYNYSGVDIRNGNFDQAQAAKSATIIAATFVVGWALKQVARRM